MPTIYTKKLVVVGDTGVGKTSLIAAYSAGSFPKETDPVAFKVYHEKVNLANDQQLALAVVDTPGDDEYDQIRPVLAYPNADMYLICFALNSKESLKSCVRKWGPEVKSWSPMKPKILVGLKKDTLSNIHPSDPNHNYYVDTDRAADVASELKIAHYFEVSSLHMSGIEELFHLVVDEIIADEQKQYNRCCIL